LAPAADNATSNARRCLQHFDQRDWCLDEDEQLRGLRVHESRARRREIDDREEVRIGRDRDVGDVLLDGVAPGDPPQRESERLRMPRCATGPRARLGARAGDGAPTAPFALATSAVAATGA
jgi:hypothetical protein